MTRREKRAEKFFGGRSFKQQAAFERILARRAMMTSETLDERIAALTALRDAASPGKLETADFVDDGEAECPCCGEGTVDRVLYENFDGRAQSIGFYGVGPEHGATEKYWRSLHTDALPLIAALRAERDEARRERDALAKFKAWVHDYLDSKGIPHHPPGTHGEHGCRIGDRMDHLFARIDETKKQLAAAVERERGMREAMELIAQQDCKTYETWQAGVEWMQEHARKALAAPPVDNQPAAGGERMQ